MKQKLKELSREKLAEILCKVMDILSKDQYKELEIMVREVTADCSNAEEFPVMARMSQELVEEKLSEIKLWMKEKSILYGQRKSYTAELMRL